MYFGGLSTMSERKVRSATNKKTDEESVDVSAKSGSGGKSGKELSNVKLGEFGQKMVYTKEVGEIPRDLLLDFLNTCTAMLLNEDNIRMVIAISEEAKMGLHQSLTEFQRQVMENNFLIEKIFGCTYMSHIPSHFPEDVILHAAAKRFMYICMRSYVNALKIRKKIYEERNETPRIEGELSRSEIMEFFEGCNALMTMPETKKQLKDSYIANGKPPNSDVVELQRSILDYMNIEKDFGCKSLGRIQHLYRADQEIMMKMSQYIVCAELAVSEACMTPEEKTTFYAQIPPFMHHFPHMHVWQQRQQMQREIMERKQQEFASQQGGHSHDHSHAAGNAANSPEELAAAQEQQNLWKSFLNTQEGQTKLRTLGTRIQEMKSRMALDLSNWDVTQRLDYFEQFGDSPLVKRMLAPTGADGISATNAIERIDAFLECSNEELEQVITVQTIVASDMQVTDNAELADRVRRVLGKNNYTTNMMPMPSLGNGVVSASSAGGHGQCTHDHSHDHSHSHGHSHGHEGHEEDMYMSALGGSGGMADVTKGNAETMDR